MEAALAVAALGESQSLFDLDPLDDYHTSTLSESQNMGCITTENSTNNTAVEQQHLFTHTSEYHNVIKSEQAHYTQGQLPRYELYNHDNTQSELGATSQVNTAEIVKDEVPVPAEHEKNLAETSQVEPVIDIVIHNVVCSFSTRCHLNLKRIALEGSNVVFKKESGVSN